MQPIGLPSCCDTSNSTAQYLYNKNDILKSPVPLRPGVNLRPFWKNLFDDMSVYWVKYSEREHLIKDEYHINNTKNVVTLRSASLLLIVRSIPCFSRGQFFSWSSISDDLLVNHGGSTKWRIQVVVRFAKHCSWQYVSSVVSLTHLT